MIRPYKETDTQHILDIWHEASLLAHPFLHPDFLQKEKRNIVEIYLPSAQTWVYDIEDKPVGFISMIGNEVGAIFLKPKYQRRGIGKRLIEHIVDRHPDLEVEVFEKNSIGRAFYKQYGFELIEKHIHEETGQPMLRLKYVT